MHKDTKKSCFLCMHMELQVDGCLCYQTMLDLTSWLLQLETLLLGNNAFKGSLPDEWSNLSQARPS